MSASVLSHDLCGNHLLSLLSEESYATLAPLLQPVTCEAREVIHQQGEPIAHVYFPCDCTFSAVIHMQDEAPIEVGTLGNEGFLGVELLAGSNQAVHSHICQIAGGSLRLPVADFLHAVGEIPAFRNVVRAYFQSHMSQMIQSPACNQFHPVEGRFARCMLMTHDRVQGDEFHLKPNLISQMLGVHRPSVSEVATVFQRAGVISYVRGQVKILDRKALEDMVCECYFKTRNQFKKLLDVSYA